MLEKIIKILLCSRVFASPTTIFSWFVIFVYSIMNSGNVMYGLLAMIGLFFAHFGLNLFDDYVDYKILIKQVGFNKDEYLKNSQKTKCRYLINGFMSEKDLLMFILIYFAIALIVGITLYIKCGVGVLYFTLVGILIILLYPFASRICLSEVMVGLAYGPALFGGMYYVMCQEYSWNVILLSIPTMIMTMILLYIHTVMDYEYDKLESKKTVANRFESQLKSLIVLKIFIVLAYMSIILMCVLDILDWQIFMVFLTIPLGIDLYKSMVKFSSDPKSVPEHKLYHFPMENMKNFEAKGEDAFMIRMYQARNLMMYFSILLIFGMIFSLAI